jgi:four helix bundle protein
MASADGAAERSLLRERTKAFALRILKVAQALPSSRHGDIIARQIARCGTSVGAQYREACRARSVSEFISKMESAAQELDETQYWLELTIESRTLPAARLGTLLEESNQLMAMFVASIRTAKRRRNE